MPLGVTLAPAESDGMVYYAMQPVKTENRSEPPNRLEIDFK